MANFDYRFEADGRRLVLQADVVAGWRRSQSRIANPKRTPKTYFGGESIRAEWQGGFVRARVSVFPRPGGLAAQWETPPSFLPHGPQRSTDGKSCVVTYPDGTQETFVDCCTIAVSSGSLVFSIDLLDETLKRPVSFHFAKRNSNGDGVFQRFYEEPVKGRVFDKCQVQVRLTFQAPRKPPPVYRSFWSRFLPGGRPESNRRRF